MELHYLIYNTPEEAVSISAVIKDETIWLTQKAMAELFCVGIPAISKHLKNIFEEGELREKAVISILETTTEHGAIAGKTQTEIINTSADKTKKQMGLTTWKNAPNGRILKSDVTVAKNYLKEKQIRQLERTVTGYFDYIEDLIEREKTFTMEEFAASIHEFLAFRKYDILDGKGSISKKQADEKAKAEYDEFNKTQKIISDFEKTLKSLSKGSNDE